MLDQLGNEALADVKGNPAVSTSPSQYASRSDHLERTWRKFWIVCCGTEMLKRELQDSVTFVDTFLVSPRARAVLPSADPSPSYASYLSGTDSYGQLTCVALSTSPCASTGRNEAMLDLSEIL